MQNFVTFCTYPFCHIVVIVVVKCIRAQKPTKSDLLKWLKVRLNAFSMQLKPGPERGFWGALWKTSAGLYWSCVDLKYSIPKELTTNHNFSRFYTVKWKMIYKEIHISGSLIQLIVLPIHSIILSPLGAEGYSNLMKENVYNRQYDAL